MRLIDADAMRKDWLENGENEYIYDANCILESIDEQPTIDAAPVVRCKDCKWFVLDTTGGAYCNHPTCGLFNGYEPDAFCSYGERKEEA